MGSQKKEAKLKEPYDPNDASAKTWFDPTGKTKYDRVVIQLHDASHAKQHVVAQLEGGGCGAASIVPFREPSDPEKPTHYGMSDLVACVRGSKVTLRFTVAPKELTISGGVYKDEHVDNVLKKVGADVWDCECPVPAKGAGWLKGWVTANGWVEKTPTPGARFLKVWVRWEEPEDVGWDNTIIGGDGNYQLIPKGMVKASSGWEKKVFDELRDHVDPREKAVLTYKIKPGNTKMLYWLPGRNDLFMHYAAAEALLDAGYDVFVMEHRRLGRANSDSTFRDFQLISHTTDLKIYMDEFEKGLAFARDLNPTYQRAILYAHSTGGLEASVWLRERGPELNFAAVVLNSPFLAWGNEGLADKALDRMGGYILYPIVKCVFGGDTGPMQGPAAQPGRYGACLWMQHPAVDQKLRNVSGIGSTVTVGWARACTRAQNALNKSQPATTLPTLLLTTPGDSVLQTDELQEMVSGFSSDAKIKSVDFCRHDMLLSYDEEKNKEVVNEMIAFLKEKEKEAWKQA